MSVVIAPHPDTKPKDWLETQPQSVAFYALGCRTNQLEASALADTFREQGWQVVPFEQPASLYVINTCTVTQGGDSESRRIIRKAVRTNPAARVAVTGCYAQISPQEITAIAGVDYVIGNNYKQDIYRILADNPPKKTPQVWVSEIDKSRILAGASQGGIHRTRASLKIQDGCDFKCTYCIIWEARGPSRSLPITDLVPQFQQLLADGHQEIVLTGINIGQYQDPQTGDDLAGLLQAFLAIEGTYRIRLSSLDPAEVTPELLAVMAAHLQHVCPYFHLSMQSAEDWVLKRMARRHREADLFAVCEAIQAAIPNAAIGADIIAGFPEETPERFERTFENFDEDAAQLFSYVYLFQADGNASSRFY